jgi:hypothetical protein
LGGKISPKNGIDFTKENAPMVAKIVAVLTLLGLIYGGLSWIDNRYAKCQEMKSIERRLDVKIEGDILNQKQDRLWKLEDRYGADPDKVQNPEIKVQMKEMKSGIAVQQNRLKALEAPH